MAPYLLPRFQKMPKELRHGELDDALVREHGQLEQRRQFEAREPGRQDRQPQHAELGDDDELALIEVPVIADQVVGDLCAGCLDIAVDVAHRSCKHDDAGKPEQPEPACLLSNDKPDVVGLRGNARDLRAQHAEYQQGNAKNE